MSSSNRSSEPKTNDNEEEDNVSPPSMGFFTAVRVLTESRIKELAEKTRQDFEKSTERTKSLILQSETYKKHFAYVGPSSPSSSTTVSASTVTTAAVLGMSSSLLGSSKKDSKKEKLEQQSASLASVASTEAEAANPHSETNQDDDEDNNVTYSLSNPPPTFMDFLNYAVPPSVVFSQKEPEEDLSFPPTRSSSKRLAVGKVKVKVHKISRLSPGTFYIDCALENNKERGPDTYEMKYFRPEQHRFELDVTDVASTVRVRCWDVNVLSRDKCVGQICIPLRKLFPRFIESTSPTKNNTTSSSSATTKTIKSSWYVLYPLDARHDKFASAKKKISHSGMKRPLKPCGYLQLSVEICPNEEISLETQSKFIQPLLRDDWVMKTYLVNPAYQARPRPIVAPTAADVARTIRHFKRQDTRFFNVFRKMASSQFPPWRSFYYAKSWKNPHFSMGYFGMHAWMALSSPVWLIPMILFAWIAMGAFLARNDPKDKVLLWHDQASDPDDALNPMQLMNKVLWMIESTARVAGTTADSMERGLHALSFRDERATSVVLFLLFVSTSLISLFLFLVPFRWFLFLLVISLGARSFTQSVRWRSRAIRTSERDSIQKHVPAWLLDYFMKWKVWGLARGKDFNVFFMYGFNISKNVLTRIPTTEELEHESIAETQLICDEDLKEELENEANNGLSKKSSSGGAASGT